MAGGIDWFRWHHGSVTDPKFGLVARKAGVRLGDVLAVWAFVLESASANDQRGTVGAIDAEALEYLLDLEHGAAYRILDAMTQRGLLGAGGVVVSWDKRQPKREDESAADRKRRQREREHELRMAACVTGDASRNVTQSHAEVTHGHDREEKRREEERREEPKDTKTARKRAAPAALVSVADLVGMGVQQSHAEDWLTARKGKSLPLTRTALEQTQAEAAKAGMTLAEAVARAAAEGWAGFKASWLQQPAQRNGAPIRASPSAAPADLAAETARLLGFAPAHDPNVIDA